MHISATGVYSDSMKSDRFKSPWYGAPPHAPPIPRVHSVVPFPLDSAMESGSCVGLLTKRHGAYLREGCECRMTQLRSTQDAITLSLFIKPCTCWTLTCLARIFLAAYAVLVLWCVCCAVHSAVYSLDASASGRRTLRNPHASRPRQGGDLPRRCPTLHFPTFVT